MTEMVMYRDGAMLEVVEPQQMYCMTTNESSEDATQLIRSHGGDFVRQPCKARGVNIKPGQNPHVARYAYIDIPMGTRHGTVLSCVHPVCVTSGRRFRYCAHCNAAVAKRNFNVRHAHGNMNSPPPKDIAPPMAVVSTTTPHYEPAIIVSDTDDQASDPSAGVSPGVPAVISIDDHKSVKSANDENPSAIMCALTRHEIDFINLLRSRPGNDYTNRIDQWKDAVLAMAEKPYGSNDPPTKCLPERAPSITAANIYAPDMTSEESSVASFGADGRLEDLDFSSLDNFFPL